MPVAVRLIVASLVVLLLAPAARTATPLIVGVTEDGMEVAPEAVRQDAGSLGLDAVRITLTWHAPLTAPDAAQQQALSSATRGAGSLRLVLSVFGDRGVDAPQTAAQRDQYCEFLRRIVAGYPAIHDVVIWNEPNKQFFWNPQYAADGTSLAPARYEALLARCWDVLHAARSDIDVLAPSTAPRGNDNPKAASGVSHSPQRFLEEVAAAYRASGRDTPIFDTLAHHVHGTTPGEPPWAVHGGGTIEEGDYVKLVSTLQRAFAGTAQPVPGRCVGGPCAGIWYVEAGFQTTVPPDKHHLYTGRENTPGVIPASEQAAQLTTALRIAACQPDVDAYFNFLLWDEPILEGWQSGLYWADRTPKPSVPAFRRAVAAAHARVASCDALRRRLPDATAVLGAPVSATTTTTTTTTATTPTAPTTTTPQTTTAQTSAASHKRGGNETKWLLGVFAVAVLGAAAILLAARRRSRRGRNSR
jgi:hypothetical protein